jgi:hypothetical protein
VASIRLPEIPYLPIFLVTIQYDVLIDHYLWWLGYEDNTCDDCYHPETAMPLHDLTLRSPVVAAQRFAHLEPILSQQQSTTLPPVCSQSRQPSWLQLPLWWRLAVPKRSERRKSGSVNKEQ